MIKLIIGISGASGVIYSIRLLQALSKKASVELVISDVAKSILKQEIGWDIKKISLEEFFLTSFKKKITLDYKLHQVDNFYAPIASGSFQTDGMIVIPCSMKTLSGIANGSSSNLIERVADVSLKERRKLVLVTRETPLSRIHIQNMLTATDAGAIIFPATPAFYLGEKTQLEMVDFIVGRVLNLFNIEHKLFEPWGSKPKI